jgi:hypothetical protein
MSSVQFAVNPVLSTPFEVHRAGEGCSSGTGAINR